ncbi:MAG: glycosyltransferase family 39 protein [Candidatus Omnitrophota bacterium]|jgi:hypothetical protein
MIKERVKILLLWLGGFLYVLPAYNKYWAPFDEGIIVVAVQRLLAGEIPYKDFFMVMYPPGQIYTLGAIFSVFQNPLIVGRIYTVLVSVAIAVLSYSMTRVLTKNKIVSIFAYVMTLTSLGPRLGTIPAPIWPGVALSLLALYVFILFLHNKKTMYVLFSGLACGAAILFRHDLGLSAGLAISLVLAVGLLWRRGIASLLIFISGVLVVTLPVIACFVRIGAAKDLYNSLISFTFVHSKTAVIPFPVPCFDPNMIFHQSLNFITVNQFYIPVIIYSVVLVILFARFMKNRNCEGAEDLSVLALAIYGILIFKEVYTRADPAHLLMMMAPATILSAYIISGAFSRKSKMGAASIIKYIVSIILIFLFALLLVKNTDKYLKNGFTKVFKKGIIKTGFPGKGTIYIPKEERAEVLDTINYIKENTSPKERIYIGNTAHWKDDFGGTLILYYLTDRLPSTKFYELLPGLVTDKDVQVEIKNSIMLHNVKLIVLQDVATDGLKKEDAPKDRLILDEFIERNYVPAAKFGKYNIYKKRGY